jgi:phasin family protein
MIDSTTQPLNEQKQPGVTIAEAMMQGAARLLEIQTTAARTLLENQSRTASMFGAPDLSSMLEPHTSFTDFFDTSAQQAAAFMRQTNDTLTQVQRQLSQLVEAQTSWMTEQMRKNMDEFTRRTGENLKHWREASRQAADEAERTAQSGQQTMQPAATTASTHAASTNTPSIVVSGGLDGTRSQQPRAEERGKVAAKR